MPEDQTPIPRVIHHCRYGGRPLSDVSRACMSTWNAVLPNYRIETWDEARGLGGSSYAEAALKAGKYAFVADYMRCHALYHHGGIYLDTDVEVLRPFDPVLDRRMFLGHETPTLVGTAIMGAAKGHPLLRRIMDTLDAEARSRRLSYRPGPELITDELAHHDASDVTVLPEEYFYPYNPHSSVAIRRKPLLGNMSDKTICVHHWEGSWLADASLRMLVGLRVSHLSRKIGRHLGYRR